jgi:hypothetical protein
MAKKRGFVVLDDMLEGPPSLWEKFVKRALKAGAKPEAAEAILERVAWLRMRGERRIWVSWEKVWKLLGGVENLEARARLERFLFGEGEYRYSEEGVGILEWAHNMRTELEYLYPERKLIAASDRAEKTRARLWSVSDAEVRYFQLFPRPVNAAKALRVFFETAVYDDFDYREEEEAEDRPALVVPSDFVVDAWPWDPRRLAKDLDPEDLEKILEKMRQGVYEGWPFEERFPPKASFLAIVWFLGKD